MELELCISIFNEARATAVCAGRWALSSFSRTGMGKAGGPPQCFFMPVSQCFLFQKVNTKGSVEELVQTLLKQARTDLEKVRVIWMWICHHIGRLGSCTEKITLLLLLLPSHSCCNLLCILSVVSHKGGWWVEGSGHGTELLELRKHCLRQHSQTHGLIFGWCCTEPGVGLHNPYGSLPPRDILRLPRNASRGYSTISASTLPILALPGPARSVCT